MATKKPFSQSAITAGEENYKIILGKDDSSTIKTVDYDSLVRAEFLPLSLGEAKEDVEEDVSGETGHDNLLIPRMAKNPTTGTLVQIVRSGTNHLAGGTLFVRTSTDNGVTWGTFTERITDPSYDVRNHGIFYGTDGRLFCIYNRYDSGTFHKSKWAYSDDDGDTWSDAEDVEDTDFTDQYTSYNTIPGVYTNRCVLDESGNYLVPLVHGWKGPDTDGIRVYLAKYTVNTEEWDWAYKLIFDGDGSTDRSGQPTECIIEDFGEGNFCIIARCKLFNSSGYNVPIMMFSDDYGETWDGNTGGDALTLTDIENSNHNSGYLYLEGAGVSLGTNSDHNECLPDIIRLDYGGSRWIVVIYWIRDDGGNQQTLLKISIANFFDYLQQGVDAFVSSTVPQELYDGHDEGSGTRNGGNGCSIRVGNDLLHVTYTQEGSSTEFSTHYLVTKPIRTYIISKMITLYNS